MPVKFFRQESFSTGNEFVKIDTDNGIESWFRKDWDPALAADLEQYEIENGSVTEVYTPPPIPEPTPGDTISMLGVEPRALHAAVKYAEAHVEHGAWDSTVQYHPGDVVTHNGYVWRATSNNSNNEPDDVPGDWEQVS